MGDTRSPTFCRHGIGSQSSSWSKARKQRIHSHDDVIKWKHFPRYWPFVQGIHRSPVNSPHKGQWRGALMFSLICTWINGWENNREAGDLRGHRAHYDVTVMNRLSIKTYGNRWTCNKVKRTSWCEITKPCVYFSACGGSFSGTTGTVDSPNFPSNYGNDMDCFYYITVNSGQVRNHSNATDPFY